MQELFGSLPLPSMPVDGGLLSMSTQQFAVWGIVPGRCDVSPCELLWLRGGLTEYLCKSMVASLQQAFAHSSSGLAVRSMEALQNMVWRDIIRVVI